MSPSNPRSSLAPHCAPVNAAAGFVRPSPMHKTLYVKIAQQFLLFPLFMGVLIFLPAGTFDYWEAWVFSAVFSACSCAITVWLIFNDPKLLERRMKAGPAAEKEPAQKIIMIFSLVSFAAAVVIPALDHRFGWSAVPASIAILGNILIVLSYVGFYVVMRENTYSAATIQVENDQKVISTGPYAVHTAPDVHGCLDDDAGHAARAWFVVGSSDAGAVCCRARMAAPRRGEAPCQELAGICGLSKAGTISADPGNLLSRHSWRTAPRSRYRFKSAITAAAALCPGAPVTPPPGCAPEPQR
jgi:hypothetical protein